MPFIVARASGPDGLTRPLAIRSLLDPKIGVSSKRAVFGMCAEPFDVPSLGVTPLASDDVPRKKRKEAKLEAAGLRE